MAVLIATGSTSAEFTVAAGESVTLVLMPTTAAGLPRGANAQIAFKGTGAINQPIAVVPEEGISVSAAGTYVATKPPGTTYTLDRN